MADGVPFQVKKQIVSLKRFPFSQDTSILQDMECLAGQKEGYFW